MLLQQYLIELMDSGQHQLLPVYACHLRAEERREVCCCAVYILPEYVRRNVSGLQKFVLHLMTSVGWSACRCIGCEQSAAPPTA